MQHLCRSLQRVAPLNYAHMALGTRVQSLHCIASLPQQISSHTSAPSLLHFKPRLTQAPHFSNHFSRSITATTAVPVPASHNAATMANPAQAAELFLEALQKDDNVLLQSPESALIKLQRLFQGGLGNLHVVTDFDCTLTRYWVNGARSATSHAVISNSPLLCAEAKAQIDKLYNEYYPIEVCHVLTTEQKTPLMEKWWRLVHDVLVSANLSRHSIEQMVEDCPVTWRDDLQPVLKLCTAQDVPVLIFSAGLADVILEILAQAGLLNPNVHVISNKMIFSEDSEQRVVGFEEPVIHVYNKSEGALSEGNVSYFQDLAHRRNVLLLGDSVGDLQMSGGMEHDICLSVGFLNHDTDKLLERYRATFDIALLNDAPMTWVHRLLQGLQATGK